MSHEPSGIELRPTPDDPEPDPRQSVVTWAKWFLRTQQSFASLSVAAGLGNSRKADWDRLDALTR